MAEDEKRGFRAAVIYDDSNPNLRMVFTEIDHAAAASQNGLTLKPRTVIVFGNPKLGTKPMEGAPTLAIDVPLRALVWQDDQDKVWLTYNSGNYLMNYVYQRHGLAMPAESAQSIDQVLASFVEEATHTQTPGPPVTPVKPL